MFFLSNNIFQKIFPVIVFILALLAPFFAFVEGAVDEEKCQAVLQDTEKECQSLSKEQCQALLNQCLDFYQKQSDFYKDKVGQTQQEKKTLQNQINILANRISQHNSEIYRNNLMISDLGLQMQDTQVSIENTTKQIEEAKERLSELLRLRVEQDNRSLIEIMFAEEHLSGFFDELAAIEALSVKNQELLQGVKNLKSVLEKQEQSLDAEKQDLERVVQVQQIQKQESQATRKEREKLLGMTESQYQQYVRQQEEAQKRVEDIRAQLLDLVGVPEAPTFGEALDLAQWVERQTGIRPALLLAIITQESALGRNVGQCYIADTTSGISVSIGGGARFTNGIHAKRDLPSFLQITREVGRNPLQTPISCPIVGIPGYGGAMGPAQFIPSTWSLYKEKVSNITSRPADPWNIRDAFLASALLLRDNGGVNNERRAALQYFAGGNWANPAYSFYGDMVVKRTNCMQSFIDTGSMSAACNKLLFIPE